MMPEPLILIPGDLDQQRGYRITKWHSFNNYECLYCQYSTLWIEKVAKHQAEGHHIWPYPTETDGKLSALESDDELKLDY